MLGSFTPQPSFLEVSYLLSPSKEQWERERERKRERHLVPRQAEQCWCFLSPGQLHWSSLLPIEMLWRTKFTPSNSPRSVGPWEIQPYLPAGSLILYSLDVQASPPPRNKSGPQTLLRGPNCWVRGNGQNSLSVPIWKHEFSAWPDITT